ncbi:hypothetical protein THAOC_15623 [Thalassiosira oceanica]|uniref:Uncharacterized protein n=1 Tax=Thalassiosira oceanica TaxID=159749 RepID=K0SEH2_THAOC|nr:hypothetical protein THAOC_15623 [Thalassiosira oceanica]|eukprot:EJK63705.1 hypothetical protein THAOC_15623 [Thalassiosira oceanica]
MPPRKRRRVAGNTAGSDADAATSDEDDEDEHVGLSCCRCWRRLASDEDHVVLGPCSCTICPSCLLKDHARRGADQLMCAGCGEAITSHRMICPARKDSQDDDDQEESVEYAPCDTGSTPSLQDVARRHLIVTNGLGAALFQSAVAPGPAGGKGEIVLLLGLRLTKTDQTIQESFVTKEMSFIPETSSKTLPDDTTDALCEFGAWLHPQVVATSVTPQALVSTLTPREFFQHSLDNYTPMLALLFGMSTGNSRRDLEKITCKDYQDHQSVYLATAVAHDVLLRCSTRYPLHFQHVIHELLESQQVSNHFRELFSAMRLSLGRCTSDKKRCKAIVQYLLHEIKVRAYDICLVMGDNLGFMVKGSDPFYVQFVLFQDMIVRKKQLIEYGIIGSITERLSCEPSKDWFKLVEDCDAEDEMIELARDTVGSNKKDEERLAESTMESIHAAIEIIESGWLQQGKDVPRFHNFISHRTRQEYEENQYIYPDAYRDHMVATTDSVNIRKIPRLHLGDRELDSREDEVESVPSLFYGADTSLNVTRADLAEQGTVAMIAQYSVQVNLKVLRIWYDENPSLRNNLAALPPSATHGAIFMCDGQPANQISLLVSADNQRFYFGKETEMPDVFPEGKPDEEKDEEEFQFDDWAANIRQRLPGFLGKGQASGSIPSRFFGKFMAFPGAFHMGMKLSNCIGTIFNNLLRTMYHAWRDTEGKLKWVLNPTNPAQIWEEEPEYVVAHYCSAYLYCWEEMGKSPSRKPTPVEVHRYMLRRAEDSPFRQAILLHLRFAEVVKILRVSAKTGPRGCVDTFLSAVRLSLPIFAMTHAKDYVRLACDLLIFMKCASPSMRKLFQEEIFTRPTETGGSQPADQAMERSVKHMRQECGKTYRKGLDKKLEAAAATRPSKPTEVQMNEELRTGDSNVKASRSRATKTVKNKSPLVSGFNYIHNILKLWHPIDDPIVKPGSGGKKDVLATPLSYEIPKGETLDPNLLNLFELGTQRCIHYCVEYYIKNPLSVDRSEAKVSLKRMLSTSADRKEARQKALNQAVSLSPEELDNAFLSDEVGEELLSTVRILNEDLKVEPPVPPISLNKVKSKRERIKLLIKHRKSLFQKDSTNEDQRRREVAQEFEVLYPQTLNDAFRVNLMDEKIYCLDSDILGRSRYTNSV